VSVHCTKANFICNEYEENCEMGRTITTVRHSCSFNLKKKKEKVKIQKKNECFSEIQLFTFKSRRM